MIAKDEVAYISQTLIYFYDWSMSITDILICLFCLCPFSDNVKPYFYNTDSYLDKEWIPDPSETIHGLPIRVFRTGAKWCIDLIKHMQKEELPMQAQERVGSLCSCLSRTIPCVYYFSCPWMTRRLPVIPLRKVR